MNKFYYTRTYTFEVQQENPKHYFFNLMDRFGEVASFKRIDKENNDIVPATIKMDGDTESVIFLYRGYEYSLRADRYIPKDYPSDIDGRLEKKDDMLKDAHLHTASNATEFEGAKECGCICCRRIFSADEVEDFAEHGETAICPYCGCDSLIADLSGIKLTKELLSNLNKKYF